MSEPLIKVIDAMDAYVLPGAINYDSRQANKIKNDLKGEFTFFYIFVFFFLHPSSGLTFGNCKEFRVPGRSFGVREFAHRGPTTRGDILDRDGRTCDKNQNFPQGPRNS